MTIANGGDNIGVYIPIFAKYDQVIEIIFNNFHDNDGRLVRNSILSRESSVNRY